MWCLPNGVMTRQCQALQGWPEKVQESVREMPGMCRKNVLGRAGMAAGVQRDCEIAALADFNKLTGLGSGSEHHSLKLL